MWADGLDGTDDVLVEAARAARAAPPAPQPPRAVDIVLGALALRCASPKVSQPRHQR
jgi:hypothetical protein